jgi:hypothetical protein
MARLSTVNSPRSLWPPSLEHAWRSKDDAVERPLWVTASPKKKARHKAGPEEHLQSFVLKALRRKPIVNFLSSLILG